MHIWWGVQRSSPRNILHFESFRTIIITIFVFKKFEKPEQIVNKQHTKRLKTKILKEVHWGPDTSIRPGKSHLVLMLSTLILESFGSVGAAPEPYNGRENPGVILEISSRLINNENNH